MKTPQSLLNVVPIKYDSDFRKSHLKLNQHYHALIFGDRQAPLSLASPINEIKKLESAWIHHDKAECYKKYHCERIVKNHYLVEQCLRDHTVFNHAIFDYLCYEADLKALKNFLLSEAILNFEFFAYLTLTLIEVSDLAKAEMTSKHKFHTHLFGNWMNDLDLPYQRESILRALSWQALAVINLFGYCSIYSDKKMIYFGLLAATEMLDPPHYKKLIQGMKRLFKTNRIDHSDYLEQEAADIDQANTWLRKVILPELEADPQKTGEFWLGFYLRLDSAKRYYDQLLQRLTTKQVA